MVVPNMGRSHLDKESQRKVNIAAIVVAFFLVLALVYVTPDVLALSGNESFLETILVFLPIILVLVGYSIFYIFCVELPYQKKIKQLEEDSSHAPR